MGSRVRGVVVVGVVLAVGAFLGSALSQWWTAPLPGETARRQVGETISGERVRVEILNGSDVNGAAARATEIFREHGFDVVAYTNADRVDHESTVVFLRTPNPDWATTAVEVLGTGTWESEQDSTRYVDLTIILGRDWSPEDESAELEVRTRPWWDIRHWFRRPGAPENGRMANPPEIG